jgi:hypothetical protein
MFDGITAMLNAKKIQALKEVELKTIEREKELKEIDKLEVSIDKHKRIDRKRMERRLNRIKKVRNFMNGLIGNGSEIKTQTEEERHAEADKKMVEINKAILGDKYSISKENNGNKTENAR